MKLLTHNMLMSPGTRNGFPLAIEVEKMEEVEAQFNAEFMARMVEKLDYGALLKTVASVCLPQHIACSRALPGCMSHPVFSRVPLLPSSMLTACGREFTASCSARQIRRGRAVSDGAASCDHGD